MAEDGEVILDEDMDAVTLVVLDLIVCPRQP
jgi:hypothetical protein